MSPGLKPWLEEPYWDVVGGGLPGEGVAIAVGIWDTELCTAPHDGQKRAPSDTCEPHCSQYIGGTY
jgi:hypothetical protein